MDRYLQNRTSYDNVRRPMSDSQRRPQTYNRTNSAAGRTSQSQYSTARSSQMQARSSVQSQNINRTAQTSYRSTASQQAAYDKNRQLQEMRNRQYAQAAQRSRQQASSVRNNQTRTTRTSQQMGRSVQSAASYRSTQQSAARSSVNSAYGRTGAAYGASRIPASNSQVRRINQERRRMLEEARKSRRRKLIVIVLILIVLILGIIVGFNYLAKNSNAKFFVKLRDKEAPVVQLHSATSINGKEVNIMDFVTSVNDTTEVTVTYIVPPDYSKEGEQQVVLQFTDEVGNTTEEKATLTVINDVLAPVVEGDSDVYVLKGDTVSYKGLISVSDDQDPEPAISIDNSQVDLGSYGDYTVKYTVSDAAGNVTYKDVVIHVTSEDDWNIMHKKALEMCDQVIAGIITPDMDDLHKVWAVYNYVRNIPYVLTDYSRDYVLEAYLMLRDYRGDCYGSYAAVRLLLERLGIENLPVENLSWAGNHFWNMVTLDGGEEWYFVDATNWSEWNNRPYMCMIGTARLNEISSFHGGTHIWDSSEYPEVCYYSMYIPDDLWGVYEIDDSLW